jgi:NAD(P)-dependent dehydrogenase (short-subunit alcohol dehydrogenase family)
VVAVIGASSGIGRETALEFARQGARVAIAARRAERLAELAEVLRAAGSTAFAMTTDVSDREQVGRFVAGAWERFGRLDVLVNSAGSGWVGRVEDTPSDVFEGLMQVNYLGAVYACQAAVPLMRRQGRGVIINVSSLGGHRAFPTGTAYCATKSALLSLTEGLRCELRGSGVTACSVHPVATRSEFAGVVARKTGRPEKEVVGKQLPPERVARAIVGCARRPRPEVYPYPPARALVWLNALAPRVVDWIAGRMAARAGWD